MITISDKLNGFLVETSEGQSVFEIEDDADYDKNKLYAVRKLLYAVIEALDCYGSKHDEYRIEVKVNEQ